MSFRIRVNGAIAAECDDAEHAEWIVDSMRDQGREIIIERVIYNVYFNGHIHSAHHKYEEALRVSPINSMGKRIQAVVIGSDNVTERRYRQPPLFGWKYRSNRRYSIKTKRIALIPQVKVVRNIFIGVFPIIAAAHLMMHWVVVMYETSLRPYRYLNPQLETEDPTERRFSLLEIR